MTLQHPYIPATEAEELEMLEAIGVQSFEELIKIIPSDLRMAGDLGLSAGLSEMEVIGELSKLAATNYPSSSGICFLGGGSYDHFVPEAVRAITQRSEFYTAYTPYQAEVSQGTLQAMYEFQSMICELSGLDVANASLYDGASAAAEACSMALSITGRTKILLPETIRPETRSVIETYLRNRSSELVTIASIDGLIDRADLAAKSVDAAAVLIQSPNVLGLVEDWAGAREALATDDTVLIADADPLTLGLQESPGAAGADIYVGEGQSLGIPLSYGGPYLGLMAAKEKYVRRLPGRIAGRTVDQDGQTGFVMVLRTREQDIRREKATSNICTNQGLMALWAAVYLSLLGKEGLRSLARLCFNKSQYLGRAIADLPGYELPFGFGYAKEFTVRPPVLAEDIRAEAECEGFLIGLVEWQGEKLLQLAVTEKRTRAELNRLVEFLGGFA
ncbi:MAG: aminomethyl-transferring glycine dehydrogenase subunit GcvPA [Fidelibacterota bacterium]|nr:MAG: aminomethyl-transferring glycine dehydrogenase subunit GcvPA [Candidatus Neomarinimicrobiota bacterium]